MSGELEPAEESAAPAPRKPRVGPVEPAPRAPRAAAVESQEPLDPMLFAGLNDTLKRMAQEKRRQRVSNLKFV